MTPDGFSPTEFLHRLRDAETLKSIAAYPNAQTGSVVEVAIERGSARAIVKGVLKPELDEFPTVARAKSLPAASPARNRMSPEQKATQRAMENPARWLAEWQAVLEREKLPVSWPAAVGEPPDAGVCGCCGTRSWWLNEDRTQGGSHWVCAACHPPPVSRVVQSKWPPIVAPPPVVAEGAAVSSGAWS